MPPFLIEISLQEVILRLDRRKLKHIQNSKLLQPRLYQYLAGLAVRNIKSGHLWILQAVNGMWQIEHWHCSSLSFNVITNESSENDVKLNAFSSLRRRHTTTRICNSANTWRLWNHCHKTSRNLPLEYQCSSAIHDTWFALVFCCLYYVIYHTNDFRFECGFCIELHTHALLWQIETSRQEITFKRRISFFFSKKKFVFVYRKYTKMTTAWKEIVTFSF